MPKCNRTSFNVQCAHCKHGSAGMPRSACRLERRNWRSITSTSKTSRPEFGTAFSVPSYTDARPREVGSM